MKQWLGGQSYACQPKVDICDINGVNYIVGSLVYDDGDQPSDLKCILRMQCPKVFGDNDIHEIVMHWANTLHQDGKHGDIYAMISQVEYDGQPSEASYIDNVIGTHISIVVDRK